MMKLAGFAFGHGAATPGEYDVPTGGDPTPGTLEV